MKELVILNNLSNKMNEVKNLGYSPLFIALKGSQNYEMDNKDSDIDAICFVVPSIEDLFYKREVSITHKCENNELIDIKDIRLLVELLRKANPSYLEILFSKYVVAFNKDGEELVRYLQENRENFAAANKTKLLKTCVGTINSKIKNLYHDAPAREEYIKNHQQHKKNQLYFGSDSEISIRYIISKIISLSITQSEFSNQIIAHIPNECSDFTINRITVILIYIVD